jgi:prepilin signal peptidase PulO-like enzyme (type II secretory pathway)
VIWFALAAAAILPVALDGVFTKADVEAPKVNRVISLAALAGLALGLGWIAAHRRFDAPFGFGPALAFGAILTVLFPGLGLL